MFRKRGQETLKDEIERWLPDEKTAMKTEKKKYLKCFSFFLLMLVVWLFRGYMVYIEGFMLVITLFQSKLTAKRLQKGKLSKQNMLLAKKVRMLPWALLAIYFAFLSIVLTSYGVMYFVFHLSIGQFDCKKWFMDSLAVFLLFEIVALQFYGIFEREV
ncbi:MAG: hypothetical protein ACI4AO_06020 [Anaerotignum sp.]